MCCMQLHLYDLVAVRKQQMGTAQTLKRTQRSALANAAAHAALDRYPASCQGKENIPSSGMHSSHLLTLPLHPGQPNVAKPKDSSLSKTGMFHFCPTQYCSAMQCQDLSCMPPCGSSGCCVVQCVLALPAAGGCSVLVKRQQNRLLH